MNKKLKKITSMLLLLCMLVTLVPQLEVANAAYKQAPGELDIEISDDGDVSIEVSEKYRNDEAKDWLNSISQIDINKVTYYSSKGNEKSYTNFTVDTDSYEIEFNKKILVQKKNTIKILATGYDIVEKEVKKEDAGGYAQYFTIRGTEEREFKADEINPKNVTALRINLDFDVDESAFNTAFKDELESISIDGKVYPKRCETDNKLFALPILRGLEIYDNYTEGENALNHYRKSDKHEIIVNFTDGSHIEYRDDGYKAPDSEDESGDPNDENKPMNYGLEIGDFIRKTPGLGWKGIKLYSDYPQKEWYKRYYEKIKYVVIDDKEVMDLSTVEGKKDVMLDGEYLAIATFIPFYEAGTSHAIRIYFEDKSFVEKIIPGYVKPKDAVDPFHQKAKPNPGVTPSPGTSEDEEKGEESSIKIKTVEIKTEYGVSEVQFTFSETDMGKVESNLAKATFFINGKKFSSDKFSSSSWKQIVKSSDTGVIAAFKEKKEVKASIRWSDGTVSRFEKKEDNGGTGSDPGNPKKISKIDDKTKIEATYDATDFTEEVDFKAVELNKDDVLKKYSEAAKYYEGESTVKAYDIGFIKKVGGDLSHKQLPKNSVEIKIPLGKISKDGLEVHKYYKIEDEDDGTIQGIDKLINSTDPLLSDINYHVEDGYIILKTTNPTMYIIKSATEKPGTGAGKPKVEDKLPEGKISEVLSIEKIEKPNFGDGTKIYLKNYDNLLKNHRNAVIKAFEDATYRINGEEITGLKGKINTSYDAIEITDKIFVDTFNSKEQSSVTITFSDKSTWNNGVKEDAKPLKKGEYKLTDSLPEGDYTLSFKAINVDTGKESMLAGYFDNEAHLVVKANGTKEITFLNNAMPEIILDFFVKSKDKYESAEKKPVENDKYKQTFKVGISDLEKKHEAGVLLTVDEGKDSDIGDYKKYKKFHIIFNEPIKSGFKGFPSILHSGRTKAENDKLLNDKLLNQKVVDSNGDGVFSPDELYNAKGFLNLSGETLGPTADVSMLKDLGPYVTKLYLAGNGIKELPEGFFDKMTGLEVLYLQGNMINKLPKNAFAKNKELREISLSANPLGHLDENLFENQKYLRVLDLSETKLDEISGNLLKNNNKLHSLYLYENNLQKLPEALFKGKKQLRTLYFFSNSITNIPNSIGDCKQLEAIGGQNNNITEIPELFLNLTKLTNLDLSNNYISKVPTGFWKRMAKNGKANPSPENKLYLDNNLISEISLSDLKQYGGTSYSFINVSKNLLKGDLTDTDIKELKDAGINIKDYAYQPQKTLLKAEAKAGEGKITLSQDMDMVELGIWLCDRGLNNIPICKNQDEYLNYLKNVLKKKYSIQTGNRARAAAKIFLKEEYDWKIKTVITKKTESNEIATIYDEFTKNSIIKKDTDVAPMDGQEFTFFDNNMRNGEKYTLTKILYVKKGTMPYQNALSYTLNFVADKDASVTPKKPDGEKEEGAWEVPIRILQESKDIDSMGNGVLGDKVIVTKTKTGYKYTFKTPKIKAAMGIDSWLKTLRVYADADRLRIKEETPVEIISKEGNRITSVAFELPDRKDIIYINMEAENMPFAANARISLDWKKAKDIVVKKDPPNSGGSTSSDTDIEKTYTIDVCLKHKTKDQDSMANAGLKGTAKVTEKGNEVTYTIYFKPIKFGNAEGSVTDMYVEGVAAKHVSGDGEFTQGFEFTRNKLHESEVSVTFDIDAMGGMQQEARLVFNSSSKNTGSGVVSSGGSGGADADKTDKDKKKDEKKKDELKKENAKKEDPKKDAKIEGKINSDSEDGIISTTGRVKVREEVKAPYVHGYVDKTFRPNKEVNRGEVAIILARFIAEKPEIKGKTPVDVPMNAWYHDAVQKLIDTKILTGYTDGTFRPGKSLTRSELVVIIARIKGIEGGKSHFKDVGDKHWAAKYIAACADKGYISGYPDGTFAPDKTVSRAELVVVMNRLFKVPEKASGNISFKDVPTSHWAYKEIKKAANN